MSHEIYYTSAPEGVKRGTSGFCTVAASDNIPKALWDRLETLSAYRHLTGAGAGAPTGSNPTSFAHWILTVTGKTHHVLSRICDSGVDHTQRTNAFAHHIVLDTAEMEAAPGGPAWMLRHAGVMAETWDGNVGALNRGGLPRGDGQEASRICRSWAALTGDAGWGGHLADLFVKSPTRPVCVLFAAGQDLLPLIGESLALLPPAARWNVTFNTYFTSMPTSATCLWRCCVAGTQAAEIGQRYAAGGLILNLADASRLPPAPDGPYTTMARTGAGEVARAKTMPGKSVPETVKVKSPASPMDDEEADEKRGDGTFYFSDEIADASIDPASLPPDDVRPAQEMPTSPSFPGRGRAQGRRSARRADEAFEEAERQAELAAQRRRKQVMLFFTLAMGAIGVGTVLTIFVLRRGAPPELSRGGTESHPVVEIVPAPQTVAAISTAPAVRVPETREVVSTEPAEIGPAPVAAAAMYPKVLETRTLLERPNIGTGIGDRTQTLSIRPNELDPARVTGLRFVMPGSQKGVPAAASSSSAYQNDSLGTLTAKSQMQGLRPAVALLWKNAGDAGSPSEVGTILWDGGKGTLEVQWHSGLLMKYPAMFNLVYWVLQNGSVELETTRAQKQRITFRPFIPPAQDFGAAQMEIPWPLEFPADALVTPPPAADLPAGWETDRYFDWGTRPASQRTPENAMQVIKFKKSTGVGVADAIFTITFLPGLGKVESDFARQLREHESDLERFESDLRSIDRQGNGAAAADKRGETVALIDAYKSAIAGYKELNKFDVFFEMPDGVRLATAPFGRPAKERGK